MRMSRDHILTSQAGSLPRPDDLLDANSARESGAATDEAAFEKTLQAAVVDVVRKQKEIGITVPGDGEFGKSMGHKVNYRAWWSYCFNRLTSFADRRDRTKFLPVYQDPDGGVYTGPGMAKWPVCTGPVVYKGHDAIKADIAHFKAALKANGVEEGFMTSVAPASASRLRNVHYKTDEEFMYAVGEAMREEYKAIIEALNPAIRGLPQDRIRFHLCWGSWHGPHTTDIPMRDIVEVMLAVKCQAYSFEAGNVRHEHEWNVWEDVKLPDGKIILPGVVSHATNVVEHPELVAQRILRFTNSVGRERVIAATDCGLGGRIHPMVAWAKLEALAQGAALASRELWH
jgi:5-methyltetrahydropteroyltriglutamate--homocysteine methyltransferase